MGGDDTVGDVLMLGVIDLDGKKKVMDGQSVTYISNEGPKSWVANEGTIVTCHLKKHRSH